MDRRHIAIDTVHQSLSRCVKALHQIRAFDEHWGDAHFQSCHQSLEDVLQRVEEAADKLQGSRTNETDT